MDTALVAAFIGLSVPSVAALMQAYSTFRQSNVERYFGMLLESGQDLTLMGQRPDLQRYLFSIVETVSLEANQEKIERWKNATIRLATDFRDFDYKDNFIRTLTDLTVFDLTILFKIYSTEFEDKHFGHELVLFFETRDVPKAMVTQSLKRLATNGLIDERVDARTFLAETGGKPLLHALYVVKNELGPRFITFVSSYSSNENIAS